MNRSTILTLLVTAAALLSSMQLLAQQFSISNTQVIVDGHAIANDYVVPEIDGLIIFDEDSCIVSQQPLVTDFYGNDFAYLCNRTAREKKSTLPQSVTSAQLFSYGRVNGNNTGSMDIDWHHVARCFTNSLEGYAASVQNDMSLTVTVEVSGLPMGTPVTVFADYSSFAAGLTEHEDVDEDPISGLNSITIDGVEVLQSTHDFANPPGLSGWNERLYEPVGISVAAGVPFDIIITSELSSVIDLPGKPYGLFATVDQSVSSFLGNVSLNLAEPNYPNGNTIGNGQIEFSLDIGSDTEMSDPQFDADEVFDPGDAYLFGGAPLPVGGLNGIKDDGFIFGTDPNPTPPDPNYVTSAPVGSGMMLSNVATQYFDLDGHDNLSTSLSQINFLTGQPSIPAFPDPCLYFPEFVTLSFDDDSVPNYLNPSGAVAVNSLSPISFNTFGQTANQDEVVEYNFIPTYPTAITAVISLYDEVTMHPSMAPNPDFGQPEDDDVDALDINLGESTCPRFYFSADHEATSVDPTTANPLDPGAVYEVLAPGMITQVVNPVTNLGLQPGVDIDAFEFVILWDTLELQPGFAMLFSVDDDDPNTVVDESSMLDPRHIYASFLNGTHFTFTPHPLQEDIDAISVWETSLNGTQSNPPVNIDEQRETGMTAKLYPNPARSEINIDFSVPQTSPLRIDILDATGRLVETLVNEPYQKGSYRLTRSTSSLAAGYYFVRVEQNEQRSIHKLVKSD